MKVTLQDSLTLFLCTFLSYLRTYHWGVAIPFICADDTQDPEEDEQQLARVKEWINDHHIDTVDLTDVLSNFPDISMVRAYDFYTLLDKQLKE